MAGATTRFEGVFTGLLTPIIPKIGGEPTREGLVELHQLVSGNVASVLPNLGGGRHRYLTLPITSEDYKSQTGFSFVLPHNPGNYPPTIGNSQDQTLGTENFQQNQALFQKYTAADRALKKQIITTVEPFLLYPLVDHLTGFGQVSARTMIQHLFLSYGTIEKST